MDIDSDDSQGSVHTTSSCGGGYKDEMKDEMKDEVKDEIKQEPDSYLPLPSLDFNRDNDMPLDHDSDDNNNDDEQNDDNQLDVLVTMKEEPGTLNDDSDGSEAGGITTQQAPGRDPQEGDSEDSDCDPEQHEKAAIAADPMAGLQHVSMAGLTQRIEQTLASACPNHDARMAKYMAIAAELFIKELTASAMKQALREGKKEIDYQHIANLAKREAFSFLKVVFAGDTQMTLI